MSRTMTARTRLGLYCGCTAPLVWLVTTLLATLVDPTFSWTDLALSNLGARPANETLSVELVIAQPEFLLFNGGLIIVAGIALGFAAVLFDESNHHLTRLGAVLYGASLLALASVGLFHVPHEAHGLAAVTHFCTAPLSLLCYGSGRVLEGDRQFGLVTIGTGLGYVLVWLVWGSWLTGIAPGVALPEFGSALWFAGWAFGTAFLRLRDDRPPTGRSPGVRSGA
jgi:hypothetical membrane protein